MQVSEITRFLEQAYDVLNDRFFDGKLTPVVITVQSSVHSHGHYTPWNSWVRSGEGYREINLSAESLRRNGVCFFYWLQMRGMKCVLEVLPV